MTQPVADAHDRTVRWRQLVDLLSRPHDEIDSALLDAALTMVRTGFKSVGRPIRAATARSIAGRAAEPRLIAIFAGDKLEVAAPLLAGAPLDEAGWAIVLKGASKEVKAFVQSLRGEAPQAKEQPPEPEAPPEHEEQAPSIGDIAARIERLKSRREVGEQAPEIPPGPAPAPPAAEPATTRGLFRWECDASGQIGWVEGAPRGALIGRSLPGEEGVPRELVRAFTDRLPFEGASVTLPGPALEGEWQLSGIPAFSPVDGRFLGYRGIARRDGELPEERPQPVPSRIAAGDAEALRETIHEIKTPLNAIIGFAEIIDGQYLGPAHRSYRLRAAEIVAQARMLLAAIEDLDFAARLQRAQGEREPVPVADFLPGLVEQWATLAAGRGVLLRVAPAGAQLRSMIDHELAERLLNRFVGALVEAATADEMLRISLEEGRGRLTISATRPGSTGHLAETQLFDPSFSTGTEDEGSKLGLGFALRLVRGLARLAGGDLILQPGEFRLVLPVARP